MNMHDTELTAEVVGPGDEGYDDAANVFFGTGMPALVVRPRDPDQVAAALAHAVRHELAVSVRSGGHSPVAHGTNTGGMVIDLVHLDAVEVVDADRRIVRVGGGATWGKVAAALEPRGWGLTAGDTTNVGVGGLTLGGGFGWMVRKHGLAIDNLIGARVVTADGRLVTASEEENPDLFWALRGGGGNFGVVVDFDFVAQQVTTVHYGTVTYRLDDPAELLVRWRDAMRDAPEELSSSLVLAPQFPGAPPTAMVLLCYAGDPGSTVAEADAAIEPLLELGTVTEADISERKYADVLEDAVHPPGLRLTGRNTLVPALDDDVIAAVAGVHPGAVPTAIAVRSLGGAFARVPAEATAFAHRDAEAMIIGAVFLPGTATDEQAEQALVPWRSVAALGTGTYISFQGSAAPEDVAAAYPPPTYARLAAVKRAYDPGNVFALNHNIEPESVEDAEGPAA
jgi:FAD/FMN-containing dehydrogenase